MSETCALCLTEMGVFTVVASVQRPRDDAALEGATAVAATTTITPLSSLQVRHLILESNHNHVDKRT
jgi:hypothetical protein